MASMDQYQRHQDDVMSRVNEMYGAIIGPLADDNTGGLISDHKHIVERANSGFKNTIFESISGPDKTTAGPMIQRAWINSAAQFYRQYGRWPDAELLASVHKSLANVLALESAKGAFNSGSVFESAGDSLATSEGIIMRNHFIAMILPIALQSITSQITNPIVASYNQAELFKMKNIAATTWAGLTAGDEIDETHNAQYSCFDRRFSLGTGDGTTAVFTFDASGGGGFGADTPTKPKSIVVYYKNIPVAKDNGEGQITGAFTNDASAATTVTGTVNHTTGDVSVTFSVAPETGKALYVKMDVNIEIKPELIPRINQTMDSRTLYPHERAIQGQNTLQALWMMRREFNIDVVSTLLNTMRNFLAGDQDRQILRELRFHAQGETTWSRAAVSGLTKREVYETIIEKLLEIDNTLMNRTEGHDGLRGIVADSSSATLLKYLGRPYFEPVSGYRRTVQPHYVGVINGQWDLYEDPLAATPYSCLCYAKGQNAAQSGYVTGAAIPPITFRHPVGPNLNYQNTLWALDMRDINPWGGEQYYHTLTITNT